MQCLHILLKDGVSLHLGCTPDDLCGPLIQTFARCLYCDQRRTMQLGRNMQHLPAGGRFFGLDVLFLAILQKVSKRPRALHEAPPWFQHGSCSWRAVQEHGPPRCCRVHRARCDPCSSCGSWCSCGMLVKTLAWARAVHECMRPHIRLNQSLMDNKA